MSENNQWPGPEGMIPEPLRNAANANLHNRKYLDEILVEMRVLDSTEADLSVNIYEEAYASPIMMPAFSHLNHVVKDGRKPMIEYAQAAKQLNLVNLVGMEPDETYAEIAAVGVPTIRIIKPFMDHDRIFEEIRFAEDHGAVAVGVDIDHIYGKDGKYDIVDGIELGPLTTADLDSFVDATSLPFIAKGVLSVQDALKCAEAGCAGIMVSHHHGRLPFGIPPLMVLPDIKEALEDTEIRIFADCGIDTGYDAFKALALGADAVSVGRGILKPLLQEGTEGVIKKVKRMNEELREMMGYTGIRNLSEMDPSVLWYHGRHL